MATFPITFGVQVDLESKRQLVEVAHRVEALGFESLTVADHPGSGASPFPTLAAVAAVTETIRLGPYVANAGLRRPIDLAADTATLDVVSDGRAFLGLGAGHTPSEWTRQGLRRPSAGERVRQLIETAEGARRLLAGECVSFAGEFVTLTEAVLVQPRPVQAAVPMLIGGNNTHLLRYAGAHADVVALSGLGRTRSDGHRHEVRWSSDEIDAGVGLVDSASVGRPSPPVRQALVQVVSVTDDRRNEAAELAHRVGTTIDVVLDAPFLLIGSIEEMVEQVLSNHARWGITSYVVRAGAIDPIGAVIEQLAATS